MTTRITLTEESRRQIVAEVTAADLCCQEVVCDAVLAVAENGGDWRAELRGAIERDAAESRRLGV